MKNKLLIIGWDVGGWMGSNHGFSILLWDYETKEYNFLSCQKESSRIGSQFSLFWHAFYNVQQFFCTLEAVEKAVLMNLSKL